jgi:O-antigen/teichoic acid export membrane protein
LMSAFAAMRTAIWVLTTVLFFQRRDAVRVWSSVALVPLKAVLLLVLCGPADLGAVGAALAAVVTDLVLLVVYVRAVYGRRGVAHGVRTAP